MRLNIFELIERVIITADIEDACKLQDSGLQSYEHTPDIMTDSATHNVSYPCRRTSQKSKPIQKSGTRVTEL